MLDQGRLPKGSGKSNLVNAHRQITPGNDRHLQWIRYRSPDGLLQAKQHEYLACPLSPVAPGLSLPACRGDAVVLLRYLPAVDFIAKPSLSPVTSKSPT